MNGRNTGSGGSAVVSWVHSDDGLEYSTAGSNHARHEDPPLKISRAPFCVRVVVLSIPLAKSRVLVSSATSRTGSPPNMLSMSSVNDELAAAWANEPLLILACYIL